MNAWALRFIGKLQKKSKEKAQLTAEEINQAKIMWEQYVQKTSIASEMNSIKNDTRNNLKNQLGLRIDENGILQCHGRVISDN